MLCAAMNQRQKNKLQSKLEWILKKPINLDAGNEQYYYQRQFTERSIKLNKKHTPIHHKCIINNQVDYENHLQTLSYMYRQLELGFSPNWMVTYHLKNPADQVKPLRETNKPYGFRDRMGYRTYGKLWNQVSKDKWIQDRRNNEFDTTKDNGCVKNLILKYLYGIKRLRKDGNYKVPNMMFFLEKGKIKLQYHIHLLLPKEGCLYNTSTDVAEVLNSSIRGRARCLSRWKNINVKQIEHPQQAVSYLNKETTGSHTSLDFYNSVLIK